MLTPLAANQSNRIDIEQQGSRAPFRGRFRVENMGFPKRQLERMQLCRVLMKQVAQVRCWVMRSCERQQHGRIIRVRKSLALARLSCLETTRNGPVSAVEPAWTCVQDICRATTGVPCTQ